VFGTFDVDNSHFRQYQQLFEENPTSKFIVTTREMTSWKKSVERWDEQNKDRDDLGDVPTNIDQYLADVTQFFVHRRVSHQLLVVDMFKMKDDELWNRLMEFLLPKDEPRPFSAAEPFPRAVVQVSGQLTQGGTVQKADGQFTSVNDAELLPGQVNTIIPITLSLKTCRSPKRAQPAQPRYERLHLDDLHRVHLLLAFDCTQFVPEIPDLAEADLKVLASKCFIAQPVSLNLTQWSRSAYIGVLRIVLGAHNIIHAVEHSQDIQAVLQDDEMVIHKLSLLLENWDTTVSWSVRQ
jgi:hypothetical protein